MSLTNPEALDVVISCVRKVGGRLVGPNDSLSAGGIVDQPRLTALVTQIAANPTLGVKKFQHQIDPTALGNIGSGDSVQDTADVVRDNAVAIERVAIAEAVVTERGAARSAGTKQVRSPSGQIRARKAPKRRAGTSVGPKTVAAKKVAGRKKKKSAAKRGRKRAKRAAPRRRSKATAKR